MKLPKIGFISMYLRNWYARHTYIALAIYTVVSAVIMFVLSVTIIFNDYIGWGTRVLVFNLFFWVGLYFFMSILDDIQQEITDRQIRFTQRQIRSMARKSLVQRGLRRSTEKTIPRGKHS